MNTDEDEPLQVTVQDFIDMAKSGEINDDDGIGRLVGEKYRWTDIAISPSEAETIDRTKYTHVNWYGK